MKYLKSHITFTKQKRYGILILLSSLIVIQCLYFFIDTSEDLPEFNSEALGQYLTEIDSLKQNSLKNKTSKIRPFNPNFISDYKGYVLGLSVDEIDRLVAFRAKNKWINSAKDFQRVTKISDSLLLKIKPYFKFPKWTASKTVSKPIFKTNNILSFKEKLDLNTVTAQQLQRVHGVGQVLSNRIIKYRKKHGGFISEVELQLIYGLPSETIEAIKKRFIVKTPRAISRLNLNTATVEQLVRIPFIDYEVAYAITQERVLLQNFKSLDQLLKVTDFPISKLEIIKLYLKLN